jgi:hypothetical protein
MEIVRVHAQVVRQVPDALRQHRDLNLGRTGVALVGCVILDYLIFVLYYRQLLRSPLCSLDLSL